MNLSSVSYKRRRFPPAIIAHVVRLYFRFPLSLRLVEEMLLERGIAVSYETVRRRAMKFGRAYARRLRRQRPSSRDIWHLDEVVFSIGGKRHGLWRAVDRDGYVLDEIVQTSRDTKAARRFRNHFVAPRFRRSALATHLHRLNAMAQWKAAAGVAA